MGEPVRVAMLGCGVVGTGVARLLRDHAGVLADRLGRGIALAGIAVRDKGAPRHPLVDRRLLTTDASALIADPGIDVVVEVMGGIEPARTLILEALAAGTPVVTANKELIASQGEALFAAADRAGVELRFEAAVAGAIPLIAPMKASLAGDRVRRVLGIVNGTTNYILWRMATTGCDYAEALALATALGYAEADPSADVGGHDAASKCAILASIAFNTRVVASDVHREGIESVSPDDLAAARRLGYVVKLLAVAEVRDGAVSARVHPAMVPSGHPLASVDEAYNAVVVEAEAAGRLMFYGRGAGSLPTASAVLGDVAEVVRRLPAGPGSRSCTCLYALPIQPLAEAVTQYFIDLEVADRPGVLAQVANVFADHDVSIRSVLQRGAGADARLELVTHRAREGDLQDTMMALASLPLVSRLVSAMRVEEEELA